jgi:hypothetical protein
MNTYKAGSALEMLAQQVRLSFRARHGKRDGAWHRGMVRGLVQAMRALSR